MHATATTPQPPVTTATITALEPLLRDARLAGADLAFVALGDGLVLTGTVRNIWQYQTLRALLGRAPVTVDVGIVATRRDDAEIAAAVRDAIAHAGASAFGRVRGGIVALSGTAPVGGRAALVAHIGTLPGVTGIVDRLHERTGA